MVARLAALPVATMTKPDILIADEILSVGDFLFREKVRKKRMAELLSSGTGYFEGQPLRDQIERSATRSPGSTTPSTPLRPDEGDHRRSTADSRKRTPCRRKLPRNKRCPKKPDNERPADLAVQDSVGGM